LFTGVVGHHKIGEDVTCVPCAHLIDSSSVYVFLLLLVTMAVRIREKGLRITFLLNRAIRCKFKTEKKKIKINVLLQKTIKTNLFSSIFAMFMLYIL